MGQVCPEVGGGGEESGVKMVAVFSHPGVRVLGLVWLDCGTLISGGGLGEGWPRGGMGVPTLGDYGSHFLGKSGRQ